jgi:glycosyltransferase involved in cell wall biosynthesis
MMDQGKISVIMPCYNAEKFLRQACESLRWQTYPFWECIIIDDGSTDASRGIIEEYCVSDSRFSLITQTNSGPSVARNKGIDASTGQYIQFLDADDVLPKDRFEHCLNLFASDPAADVVYTEYITYRSGQGFSRIVPAKFNVEDAFSSMVLHHNRSFVATIHEFLFKRRVMAENKFDASLPPYCEDVECWIRIALTGVRFVYLNEILAVYRFAGESLSSQEIAVNKAKLFLLERYRDHALIRKAPNAYHEAHAYFSERLVIALFMNKEFNNGLRAMVKQMGNSRIGGIAKMAGWFFLMLVMTKQRFASLRAGVVKYSPYKWGGWKQFAVWSPPEELARFMEGKT